LISSGQSAHDNYLFGVSESGDDAFIYTSDLLTPQDGDETPSVYDVRVKGGFPPPSSNGAECLGEACQPAAVAPDDPTPASAGFQGAGNVKPEGASEGRCAKGRHKVKGRCRPARKKHAKKHKHAKKTHKRTNPDRRTAR
jgi:hypothetical protein